MTYFAGIDLGSSYAKAAIIDAQGRLCGHAVQKTGIHFDKIAAIVFEQALAAAAVDPDAVTRVVSTGVGRNNCSFAAFNKPEIGCFGHGAFHLFGGPCTVIDIGGQDNKVIAMSAEGKQLDFKMNRKCAAGTGSFLEDIANRLHLGINEMNTMAASSDTITEIGSYCTVFAGTEVIQHLRDGGDTHALMRGVFASVVKRVLEMTAIHNPVILTGGTFAHFPVLIDLFNAHLSAPAQVPKIPQIVGALGAAIYALRAKGPIPNR